MKPIQILSYETNQTTAFAWGELTWYASQPLGNSEEMTLGLCRLKPHQANPRHYHPNCSEVLTVLQGTIEHTDASGGWVTLKEQDTVTIPSHVWHQARNLGDTDALLFIAFSSANRETIGE